MGKGMRLCGTTRILVLALAMASVPLCLSGCRQEKSSSAKAKWQDHANWRQIRPGMSADQVRNLLGEPTAVHSDPAFIRWTFGEGPNAGTAVFFASGELKDWHAPR
jgi:hypothetical protein